MGSKFAGQEVMINETLSGKITVYYHGEAILTYTRDDKVRSKNAWYGILFLEASSVRVLHQIELWVI
ncbi:hypothetical protein [Fictibacillus sp. FJAT-27399]|uniref:hypothetical protein n=1 Tax=Fictibacillus sp. FJAT-27399 TaxID=1729689 RepID=UPI0012E3E681|nr:hypothetical protein [Fictibacillus sp. FJAT-27399]